MTTRYKPPVYDKLDPTFKTTWLKALRSGELTQNRNGLFNHETHGMCCIGVGAAVYMNPEYPSMDSLVFGLADEMETDRDYVLESGSSASTGGAGGNDYTTEASSLFDLDVNARTALVDMNDAQQKDFREIALWIEKNL